MTMNWQQLISNKRLGQEHRHPIRHDDRTEFKRDYDRLIFSAPFRRMQNKTQVFPLPGSIFVHNRLTHSLEVASVGMSLGNDVAQMLTHKHPELKDTLFQEIGQIVATACLAHDMGNPPFGHSGEKAIQAFFKEGKGKALKQHVSPAFWEDITHFEGNAYAFRLLTHQFKGRRPGGFVMTYSTLASIVKYPFPASMAGSHGKFGYFQSEREYYLRLCDEMGIKCIEESGNQNLTYEETKDLLLGFFEPETQQKILQRIEEEGVSDNNEKIVYMRACVIGRLEHECVQAFVEEEEAILNGSFTGSLIEHISPLQRDNYIRCTQISKKKIYRSKPVLDVELSGYKIMDTLLDQMVEAVCFPDRFYSKQLIGRVSNQYDIDNEDFETRLMAVIDYICGMTDVFALDAYQKMLGISLPIV